MQNNIDCINLKGKERTKVIHFIHNKACN